MATIRRKSLSPCHLVEPRPRPQVLINCQDGLASSMCSTHHAVQCQLHHGLPADGRQRFYYIKSQMLCLGLGLAVMLFSPIDHRFLRRMVWPGCCLHQDAHRSAVQCALNGQSRRWLRIGFTIQVSEIARDDPAHGPSGRESAPSGKAGPASGRGASRQASGSHQRIVRNSSSCCCPSSRWLTPAHA